MKKYDYLPGISDQTGPNDPHGFHVGAWSNETILAALQVLYQKLQDIEMASNSGEAK